MLSRLKIIDTPRRGGAHQSLCNCLDLCYYGIQKLQYVYQGSQSQVVALRLTTQKWVTDLF